MMQKTVILAAIILSVPSIAPVLRHSSTNRSKNDSNTSNTPAPQLIDKLAAAKKPAVGQPLVIDGHTSCGAKGNATDPKMQELNNNKNRTDEPADSDLIAISWDDLKDLPTDK